MSGRRGSSARVQWRQLAPGRTRAINSSRHYSTLYYNIRPVHVQLVNGGWRIVGSRRWRRKATIGGSQKVKTKHHTRSWRLMTLFYKIPIQRQLTRAFAWPTWPADGSTVRGGVSAVSGISEQDPVGDQCGFALRHKLKIDDGRQGHFHVLCW